MPIDRSQFIDEIQQNPWLIQRMADMVKGEVGYSDPTLAKIQLESVFNRAQSRGIPLSQALQSVSDNPRTGYYASDTYSRPASKSDLQNFQQNILPDVLGGSDYGTQKLGFFVTGNASGSFAANRANNGVYANSAWYSGKPQNGEMFVTERRDANFQPGTAASPSLFASGTGTADPYSSFTPNTTTQAPSLTSAVTVPPTQVAGNNTGYSTFGAPQTPGTQAPALSTPSEVASRYISDITPTPVTTTAFNNSATTNSGILPSLFGSSTGLTGTNPIGAIGSLANLFGAGQTNVGQISAQAANSALQSTNNASAQAAGQGLQQGIGTAQQGASQAGQAAQSAQQPAQQTQQYAAQYAQAPQQQPQLNQSNQADQMNQASSQQAQANLNQVIQQLLQRQTGLRKGFA